MRFSLKVLVINFFISELFIDRLVSVTVTCDFEIDACNWIMDPTWKVYPSGSTADTASSGPIQDHTSGTGNYARFMGTRLTDPNQFGLMTVNTSLKIPTSFSFWYFMHGTQIGTLSMIVNDQILWQKSKRQGAPAWYQANIMLPSGINIQIIFAANRTDLGRSSDIALDDIILAGEPISISTRSTPRRPITTPRIRVNASCDFDVDQETCGWKSESKYGWRIIAQREANITNGPTSDYSSITRGNVDGKFCAIPYDDNGPEYYCLPYQKVTRCKGSDTKYINCRDGSFAQIQTGLFDYIGERSQFKSPVLDALSTNGCVQFQYNIASTDEDRLTVYVEDYWTERQTCMWHTNGSSIPNRWVAAEVPLRLQINGKYRIVFDARKVQAGGDGLISIDHIVVSAMPCSGLFFVPECPREEVTTTTTSTSTITSTKIVDETSVTIANTTISTTTIMMTTTITTKVTTSATTPAIITNTPTTIIRTTVLPNSNIPTTVSSTASATNITSIIIATTGTTTVKEIQSSLSVTTTSQSQTTSTLPLKVTTTTMIQNQSTTAQSTTSASSLGTSEPITRKPSLGTRAIVGIVIGVCVGIVIGACVGMTIVVVSAFMYHRYRTKKIHPSNHSTLDSRFTS